MSTIQTAKNIFIEPARSMENRFKFYINNNKKVYHTVDSKKLYKTLAPFFSDDIEKLGKLSKLIKESQPFEVDTVNKKIYLWKVSRETIVQEAKKKAWNNMVDPETYRKMSQ